ncbi:TetR/AcrR family transcriptional regulator [Streptomyces sp. NPDC059142]|uniref:TetR/AcrR family transcriptional regulator n=1 Tax=Streptomyces sp. NPDC059142 TaxID=3346739 RepID=UPI0036CC4822
MRPSQKHVIIDAAIRVTERDGITGLTLESAAEEAGVTKGGLMYHFRTRNALLMAIQQHLTRQWEDYLEAELGKPAAEATTRETMAAYVRAGAWGSGGKADLAFMLEAEASPELATVWNDLIARWAPPPTSTDPHDIDLLLARLAVDGLWIMGATGGAPLTKPVQAALRDRLNALLDNTDTKTD